MHNEQLLQEAQYEFPYHYIPKWDGRDFSQSRCMGMGYEYISYMMFVIDKVIETQFHSLLDVGCGDGRFLSELKRRAPDKRLVGVDYSSKAISFAHAMNVGIEFLHGDIRCSEVANELFDAVTLVETLEHIPPDEVKTFVRALSGRVHRHGTLVVTVPSTNIPAVGKHYQHFNRVTLAQSLGPAFAIDSLFFVNPHSLRRRLIKTLLSNRLFILNCRWLRSLCYRYYADRLFYAKETNCRRLIAVCTKADTDGEE